MLSLILIVGKERDWNHHASKPQLPGDVLSRRLGRD